MNRGEVKRKQIQLMVQLLWIAVWLMLGKRTGSKGVAYFAMVYETIAICLSLFAGRTQESLGKILKSRYAKGQGRSAGSIKKQILILQAIIAIIVGSVLFLSADLIANKILSVPGSMIPLRIMALAVPFQILSSVFLGFFQGEKTYYPSVLVTVLRQIMYLVLGLVLVGRMQAYGLKLEALLLNETMPAVYGAVGMAYAVLITEFILLFFVVVMYLLFRRRNQESGRKQKESFGQITGTYVSMTAPLAIKDVLLRIPVLLGIILYVQNSAASVEADAVEAVTANPQLKGASLDVLTNIGIYYGGYLMIVAIPFIVCSCMLLPLCMKSVSMALKGEVKTAREGIGAALHSGLAMSLFGTVMIIVLSKQIAELLPVNGEACIEAAKLLQNGCWGILFAVPAMIFVKSLYSLGRKKVIVFLMLAYCLVFCAGAFLCTVLNGYDMKDQVYCLNISVFVLCFASAFLLRKVVRFAWNPLRGIGMPAVAVLLSGLIGFLICRYFSEVLGCFMTIVLCLVICGTVYILLLLFLRSFTRRELEWIPGGNLLHNIAQMLRINF